MKVEQHNVPGWSILNGAQGLDPIQYVPVWLTTRHSSALLTIAGVFSDSRLVRIDESAQMILHCDRLTDTILMLPTGSEFPRFLILNIDSDDLKSILKGIAMEN